MQKKKKRTLFYKKITLVLLAISLITGCIKKIRNNVDFEQVEINLKDKVNNYTLSGLPKNGGETVKFKTIPPKISIPENMPLIKTLNLNLDSDTPDEQIILVKESNNINARFKILIADYIQILEYYRLTSELTTQSSNIQNFDLNIIDVIGDHNLEIVCSGYNNKAEQTIDIFKYNSATSASGLKYINILSLASTGSIEISQKRIGTSYPVICQEESSEKSSELIYKKFYAWNPTSDKNNVIGQYELSHVQTLKKDKVEDEQLKAIINSNTNKTRLEYLNGQWQLEGQSKPEIYLFFDFKENCFNIYTDYLLKKGESNIENYIYTNAYRPYYNRLRLQGVNELHDFKKVTFNISFYTMDKMKVDILDNDSRNAKHKPNTQRSGVYKRITIDHLKKISQLNTTKNVKIPNISGLYKERLGRQYIFEAPYFKIKNKEDIITRGGYAIYTANVPIMEMLTFTKQGVVEKRDCYKFSYSESKTGRKLFRTITLIPGKITINGFIETSKEPIKLENEEFTVEENQ